MEQVMPTLYAVFYVVAIGAASAAALWFLLWLGPATADQGRKPRK